MSVDPLSHGETLEPAALSFIDSDGIHRGETDAGELGRLRSDLETERSAGTAMLVTVLELEKRLAGERSTGQALLASVRGLEAELSEERRAGREQRLENQRMWGDIQELEIAVRAAETPLWRKLLRRA